jgi:tetratricopeptide (TPR) repeat protein
MRWLLATVTVCALMGSARADNKALARDLFREGTRQYDLGDYSKALELFKKAYLNFEEPAILFNLAQCQRQLGDKPEAVKLYRSFLRKVPDSPARPEVERIIARLESEIAQEQASKKTPPQGTLAPVERPAPPPSVAPQTAVRETPKSVDHTPVYRKWWLWTAVAAVVVVGASVGLGVGLSSQPTKFDPTLHGFGPGMKTSALVSW